MGSGVLEMDEHSLMNQEEAARLLDVSPRSLEGWRLNGGGPPFHRLGKRRAVKYSRIDLLNWIETHRFTSTSGEASSSG